jgi:hypothetical protein
LNLTDRYRRVLTAGFHESVAIAFGHGVVVFVSRCALLYYAADFTTI